MGNRTLEELLILETSTPPDCDMAPDQGRHKAKAAVRYKINKDLGAPMFANVCKRDMATFTNRAVDAGFEIEVIREWK